MDLGCGYKLSFRNILGLSQCWIGSETRIRRNQVYLFVGNLYSGLLILLVNFLYGRLGMEPMFELVWIPGQVVNGASAYLHT